MSIPTDDEPIEMRRPELARLDDADDETRLRILTTTLETMRRELDGIA
ncbi:hypothetical protein G1C96_0447 [Bifidobacterium sp. DSM 109958]|uniref:Uncharacterized protein n=1 Tax=Bifidobacterium moraviense TaxID=2675323 RepID=A0A7Y0F0Q3_9BIFI|nr:hypothetical protein [Bifidobacterium sp. DSM 109958]NMM99869.1 hypothetical protein [Bifidobacterium sp. DSM 109958]